MNTNNKISILLIDENPEDIKTLKGILHKTPIKHTLIVAKGLNNAFDIILQNSIDLVLLELNLVETTGFKTLTAFKENVNNLPFIIVTTINNEIIGNQSVKAGAQDFLVKWQFNGKLLGRAIRYALHRFKTTRKLEETVKNLSISKKRFLDAQSMAQFGNFDMDIVSSSMKWTKEIFNIFGLRPFSIEPTLSDYLRYVHIEDKANVSAFFDEISESGKLNKIEHRIVQEDHTIKYLILNAKVFYDEITDKILLIGGVQDITERKLNEQLILEKNISNKASKVKEEVLMNIGFHIRTPLASIVNLLFVLESSRLNLQQKEFINDLKTSVDDLSIMVNNLLNFSLLVADKIKIEEEQIKLGELLQSLKRLIQIKTNGSNQEIQFDFPNKTNILAYSDPKKITQIIFNLIDFAIKNNTSKSLLCFKIKVTKISRDKSLLIFNLVDDTTNLSEEKLKTFEEAEKLLDVHSREIRKEGEHELLNIAMVSKLTKILNGEFQIENHHDKDGINYTVKLPVRVANSIPFSLNAKPSSPIKILLVEDHFLNQIATKKVLTTWSEYVSVDIAENGLVGVEKFKEYRYDIILMDIQMPIMNGIEATKRIRDFSEVPIIALTANASKQEADKCIAAGMNDYLGKPFKPQELYAKIMNALVLVEV